MLFNIAILFVRYNEIKVEFNHATSVLCFFKQAKQHCKYLHVCTTEKMTT